ncbi:hypothetical protein FT663_01930 [Candidozyma haemuli var. vulneris]|nr:hypothetical protein FT662_02657 [[Candida] haemuloni var. vulneris]KAF3993340.1 hypothetical protein FT663_01930 [[Candida] haemuloni var. vulneris]
MSSEMLLSSFVRHGTIREDGISLTGPSSSNNGASASELCCSGSGSSDPATKYLIEYSDIIWCESANDNTVVKVFYIERVGKTLEVKNMLVDVSYAAENHDIASLILKKAYKGSIVAPSVLIVLNSFGGKGKAREIYKSSILPVLQAAHVNVTYQETTHQGHAVEIGRDIDESKYDVIACCSGDGVPHEIMNGMFEREGSGESAFDKIAITQLPCGSGNALSLSTHGTNDAAMAAFRMLKAERTKMDVMAVTQMENDVEQTRISFVSQAYGSIADADIGTESLRWMGPIRFEIGVAHKLITKAKYPCDLWVHYGCEGHEVKSHFERHQKGQMTAEGSTKQIYPKLTEEPPAEWEKMQPEISDNVNIFYVGKMPYMSDQAQFFPAALPQDGMMDMLVTNAKAPLLHMIGLFTKIDRGAHVHSNEVIHAKVLGYRLVPKVDDDRKHYISVDGENFPLSPIQVEVVPRAVTVLLQGGSYVDTCFTDSGSD